MRPAQTCSRCTVCIASPYIRTLTHGLDRFIDQEIKPLQAQDDNERFFDHRREWARTDFDNGGLPRHEWEALLAERKRAPTRPAYCASRCPRNTAARTAATCGWRHPRAPGRKGLGLHNDLQNEHSIVGNFPIVLMLRDFGTPAQKAKFIPACWPARPASPSA
jgi:acyl-CoA dehydrogenase